MKRCENNVCENCTCGRRVRVAVDSVAGNANFAPAKKPQRVIRRDVREAAVRLEQRFKETMKILA